MQCPFCRSWNADELAFDGSKDGTVLLSDSDFQPIKHITTGPWDACFGQTVDDDGKMNVGIVAGTTALLGGAPGAGKSTLSLQFSHALAMATQREVLYIACEEANGPIRSRAKRLGFMHTNLIRMVPMGVTVDLASVILNRTPVAIVLDSLSKACPDPDEAVQFAKRLKEFCTAIDAAGILIDHVTKEEDFAGLMALQHEVDSTLLFTVYEDEVRELKTVKNRNGPTMKMLFNMTERGLIWRDPEEDEAETE